MIAARQAVESEVNLAAVKKSTTLGTTRFTDVLVALAQVTKANRDMSSAEYSAFRAG